MARKLDKLTRETVASVRMDVRRVIDVGDGCDVILHNGERHRVGMEKWEVEAIVWPIPKRSMNDYGLHSHPTEGLFRVRP